MAMGKYSRVDGRKSSGYCSTVTVVVFVGLCLVGVWMLMSSTVVPVRDPELSSGEAISEVKQRVSEIVSWPFEENKGDEREDSTNGDGDDVPVEKSDNRAEDNQEEKNVSEGDGETSESKNMVNQNQEENSVKESSDEKTESEEESKAESENDKGRKREAGESKGEGGDSKSEAGETEDGETNKTEQTESEESLDENKSESGEASQTEKEKDSQDQDNDTESHGKDQVSTVIFPSGDQSEILNGTNAQNGAWSTQASESQNEKESQQSSITTDQHGHLWKVCNATAGPDYIPCLDNWHAIRKLSSTKHYEHRERHCPEEAPTCIVPLPEGYKRSIKWPKSRDRIWYHNVPHTKLAEVKGHQNWVKVTGEYLTFPGGGTQFKNGALHYIDFIQKSRPDIAWGNRSRVILDVGCGVASFGGYLYEKDVIAMSFAPKDEHEAQVQFALERGIPAILSVMGTKRLPFPSSVFDLVHCARCRVPWHVEGGKLLLELNRVLRPGGYFVWSATPVYQKLPEDVGIWKGIGYLVKFPPKRCDAMTELTKLMCWDLKAIKRDKLNAVGAAIFRKPTSNECYNKRPQNEPPLCADSDDANAAWNVPLQACMHKVPVDKSKRGSRWPLQWPLRLEKPPYWLNSEAGVYGKAAPEDFTADYQHWKNVVSNSYLNGMGINWSFVRNVMDMRAVYGGFAAALKDLKVWVMNVVPIDSPDTLPIIYERGLFGLYHDWCESFNTYPRTYDLLHADHLFSTIKKRCSLKAVVAEVDRILRPDGNLILRDDAETIVEVEDLVKSLHWDVRMIYTNDNQGMLCVHKTYWRPKETETILSAMM